jgi:hypothetical protein
MQYGALPGSLGKSGRRCPRRVDAHVGEGGPYGRCVEILLKLIPIVFSSVALLISALTYITKQRQDRRDLFLKMHERLIDPDIQMGRRLLFERVDSQEAAARLRTSALEEYQLINRALAMFDIFAMYVQRGYIDRELALEEWGHSFARTFRQSQPFIADRLAVQRWSAWPHLRSFGPQAVAWHEKDARGSAEGQAG